MNTKTGEETTGPLGVIGSLTAGFELVSRHLWLIGLPVLLDLLLWLGPRLSTVPVLQQFVALLVARPAPDAETARQVEQAAQLLGQLGEQFNLFSLLSALPLLDVPSLLARHAPGVGSPLGEARVLPVTSVLALMVWAATLAPAGLALGFLYLNSLARRVRVLRSHAPTLPHPHTSTPLRSSRVGKLVSFFLFATGLLMAGVTLVPLWTLLVGTTLTISPLLGFMVWLLSVGFGGYLVLHLLFVVPGVLLGERGLFQATWESMVLIQTQFPSVVGLLLLVIVIYEGLGFVWSLPSDDSWSLLIGILGNSCIATGLTAALFVFYQEREAGGRGRGDKETRGR